jgi:hypothetical protein
MTNGGFSVDAFLALCSLWRKTVSQIIIIREEGERLITVKLNLGGQLKDNRE